ncbi:transmembrane protein, putative [Actinidia rufa]|uniref:Transmembrane protein, putative n=1 Tax=Actinidia rufa TaxID=165716 RepID=A0A7J0FN68_9ERIC|nr:transmembrane protein, putative [Actinidia rufa]
MDHSEGIGIKIYKGSPQADPFAAADMATTADGGRKRRAVASGVQKTLWYCRRRTDPASARRWTTHMITALLGLCTLSCFFFHFTDSFRGPDGNGILRVRDSEGPGGVQVGSGRGSPQDERYRVGLNDFIHAIMSAMVFMAIAFSDQRVTDCLFREHAKDIEEVMESFPLMVGIICSALFLVFPNSRYGIGCMAA